VTNAPRGEIEAAGEIPRRLAFFNAGLLWQPRVRRILSLAGHELVPAGVGGAEAVVVWGHSPYAKRGARAAEARGLPLIRVEDAFLRSIHPGRKGDAPLGLIIDDLGVHFDSSRASRLEQILARNPLDDANLLRRAREGMTRMARAQLSKYNATDPTLPPPPAGYVLVIDQTRDDAAIRHAGASAATFADMLAEARLAHPRSRILIKTHPETAMGLRAGHFGAGDCDERTSLYDDPLPPRALLEGAVAVYTVSSQMGFEAILAGHRPHVFGQPFYAGWGLTDDRMPVQRRTRRLTPTQVFAAAMILAPVWYDACRDRLCSFEEALDQLEAEVRAYREDRRGYVATGMRLWKRGWLQRAFGRERAIRFRSDAGRAAKLAARLDRPLMVWGTMAQDLRPAGVPVLRVEDGFLRSRGLGAALIAPTSLILDDLGLHYDPKHESRMEQHITAPLTDGDLARAERLALRIVHTGVTKYNLPGGLPELPPGRRVLVPGQVEDDASIILGCDQVRTNVDLLRATRAANPDAVIVFKPHPDVVAGLRKGAVDPGVLQRDGLADVIADGADAAALIHACDEVWTMTSLLGFEALLRGKPVTCLGTPFYSGWGLTTDLGPVPERRRRAPDGHPLPRPSLMHLAHAALIAAPRYFDPKTGQPCSPEAALDRLIAGEPAAQGALLRGLSKLQGMFASQARLWRRGQ
jgi:capsular polysaccharide export protein